MAGSEKEAQRKRTLRVTENALDNIDEITEHIAVEKQEPLSAIAVGDKIYETIDRIKLNPLAFRECEEIPTKTKIYRKAVCMSWLIIFKIKPKEIVVLGVISGSRRPAKIKKLRKVKK
mgnify:CR=1 FL=1